MNEQTNNKPPHNRPQRPGGGRSQQGGGNRRPTSKPGMASRGDAIRAQKRAVDMAHRLANEFADAAGNQAPRSEPRRANQIAEDFEKLKVVILGGLNDVGEKNMMVIEYKNDALIIDCGNDLSVDLPGVNYAVNDPTYLESIKNKIRGYVISHGHLDHIGGLRHIAPKFPAPIYGSRFSIGMVEMTFENAAADTGLSFKPETVVMNMDGHERNPLPDGTGGWIDIGNGETTPAERLANGLLAILAYPHRWCGISREFLDVAIEQKDPAPSCTPSPRAAQSCRHHHRQYRALSAATEQKRQAKNAMTGMR
jgi:hypothetical protein